jgi:predicted phage-related endonuclease
VSAAPVVVEPTERDAFLAERAPTIGGSDVPAILGLSKYRDPFSVWLRITEARAGRVPPQTEDSDRLEMGRLMEPVIAGRAARRMGVTLREVPRLVHPQFPWMTGAVDREIVEEDGDVECKSVEWDPLKLWSDPDLGEVQRIPEDYYVQVVTYIGLRIARKEARPHHVAAQFGFQKLRLYRYDPDRLIVATWQAILEKMHAFWETYVVTGNPPPVGSSPATEAWLKAKFPMHGDEKPVRVDNSDDVAEVFRAYKQAKEQFDVAEKTKDALENEIRRLVGDSYGLEGQNGGLSYRATWPYIKAKTALVTDYEKILGELVEMHKIDVPAQLIQKHSRVATVKAGYRRLSPAVVKET